MEWFQLGQLLLPVALLVVGYVVGRILESRHYVSIRAREQALRGIVALNTRRVPEGVDAVDACLLSSSVVVSSDYFKSFVAGFRNLVGGRFRGYETLMERARREALLRLKAQAQDAGCPLVIGVRFHSTRIAGASTASMEVMAYGTGLRLRNGASASVPSPGGAA